jgi:hypothetical protein
MSKPKYDINGMIKAFLDNQVADRAILVKEMRLACIHSREAQRLLRQVLEESLSKGAQPATCVNIAMMYGMVVGVLVERDRTERDKAPRIIM